MGANCTVPSADNLHFPATREGLLREPWKSTIRRQGFGERHRSKGRALILGPPLSDHGPLVLPWGVVEHPVCPSYGGNVEHLTRAMRRVLCRMAMDFPYVRVTIPFLPTLLEELGEAYDLTAVLDKQGWYWTSPSTAAATLAAICPEGDIGNTVVAMGGMFRGQLARETMPIVVDAFLNEGIKVLFRVACVLATAPPTSYPLTASGSASVLSKAFALPLSRTQFTSKGEVNLPPIPAEGLYTRPRGIDATSLPITGDMWETLFTWLPPEILPSHLEKVFTTKNDGVGLLSLLDKCMVPRPHLILVQAEGKGGDEVVGFFTTSELRVEAASYGNPRGCFPFRLLPKMERFTPLPSSTPPSPIISPPGMLSLASGGGGPFLGFTNGALASGHSSPSAAYGTPCVCGGKFDVVVLEVYAFSP